MHLRIAAAFALLAGCPSSQGPATKLQQRPPTVASADPAAQASLLPCPTPARADLMVVDWTPEARSDLEVAMKEGLALVAYDCKSAALVGECSLVGDYSYIGTTRREKKIELATSDDVAANLPVSGLSWLTEVGGKFGREMRRIHARQQAPARAVRRDRAHRARADRCGASRATRAGRGDVRTWLRDG